MPRRMTLAVAFAATVASLALASSAGAALFGGAQTGPSEWTYELTYEPLDNYAVCPAPGNVATITLSGLSGVVAAGAPTATDFDHGSSLDAVNLRWTPRVSTDGTSVTWTHVGPGTGNFPVAKHVYGFTVRTAGPAPSAQVHAETAGFSVDAGCPVQPAADRNFAGTTQGPHGTPTPPPPLLLYVTDGNYSGWSGGSLLRIDPVGHGVDLLTAPGTPGVATGFVAVTRDAVYWGGSEAYLGGPGVRRANLDGSGAQLLVGSWMPEGVAVDEADGKVYWAEAAQHAIRRANLDGSSAEELASGLGCCSIASPMGVALDLTHGKLYWASMAYHTIQRSNLDGTNVETLVTVPGWPSGIALDPVDAKLYWVEQGGAIWRSNLDGTQVQPVLLGLAPYLMGLAVDPVGRTMYWTAREPGRVMKAKLDGTGVETVLDTGLGAVTGIAVYRRDTTPPVLTVRDVTVDATSPAGALVAYTASAVDDVDASPTIVCTHATGTLFPIGLTTVTCTATDASGNAATAAFVVHVQGATDQLDDLAALVRNSGPGTSLSDKLADARSALASGDVGGACSIVDAFSHEVAAQTGKKLTPAFAASTLADARRIGSVLGC